MRPIRNTCWDLCWHLGFLFNLALTRHTSNGLSIVWLADMKVCDKSLSMLMASGRWKSGTRHPTGVCYKQYGEVSDKKYLDILEEHSLTPYSH